MKSQFLLKPLSAGLLLATLLAPTALQAAATDPVGYTTITPTPSPDGTTRRFTVVSFPLSDAPKFAGAITSASGAVLTVSTATWTPNEFGPTPAGFITHVAIPYSGNATGRSYSIISNTATQLTIDLPNGVTDLGTSMANGDTIRIIPVNTLRKIFGDPSAAQNPTPLPNRWNTSSSTSIADLVYIWVQGTGWRLHYYAGGIWKNSPAGEDLGDTPIFPDEAVWISRRSTNNGADVMKIVVDGSVPVVSAVSPLVEGSGSSNRFFTCVSTGYPKDIKLSDFGLPAGWVQSNSTSIADLVYIWNSEGNTWDSYFKNGSGVWAQGSFNNTTNVTTGLPYADTILPANSGIWIARRSLPSGESQLFSSISRPFTP